MLEKTMKQVINKKINQWLASIDNETIRNIIKENLVITGGCFTSMILNEAPKDFDCYLKTKEATYEVAKYYADLWNEANKAQKNALGKRTKVFVLDGDNPSQEILDYYKVSNIKESRSRMIANIPKDRIKIIFPSDGVVGDPNAVDADKELGEEPGFIESTQANFSSNYEAVQEIDEVVAQEIEDQEKKDYFPVFFSTNAITLSRGIQIIVRFYGEPEEVHKSFDFAHTKGYWTSRDNKIVISKEVYEYTVNKTLKYTGSLYPVASLFRMRKFIERGWKCNAGQIFLMAKQTSDIDLNNIDVMEEQLVGLDSLYFAALIEQFRRQKENNPDFDLTTNYVMSIIDKIF